MVKAQSGFTLTEILIVIAITGVLAAATAPYSSNWTDTTNVRHATDMLNQSFQNGKTVALRNPLQVVGSNPAAGLNLESGILLLCQGDPADSNCTAGGSRVVWQSTIPDGVTVQINGANLTNIEIDNTGGAIDGSGNTLAVAYSISRGSKNATGTLF